ncbi:MAG: GNAT family N-acetyltransferase [Candidatus Devosia phytovorans]|uniref:GNAT family N-acetyltransferase n=1 Tax=Candidatus Devosia phytovorans TaxID=3121372 RepID=A0AAJ6B145_9HYPH|nr:GNAT family N-acetyltransferase [Devosia sp.]WEK05391.1 MAG: GNAT family N-acetyltransferase [Devosia sp.]
MIEIVSDPFPSDTALSVLWLSAWGELGPDSFAEILARSLAHVGAFEGERLVGFVNVAWDGGVHAFVLDTCVHADFQRQGIATRLLSRATELARDRGAHWLHVDFELQLTTLYRAAGFGPTAAGLKRLR